MMINLPQFSTMARGPNGWVRAVQTQPVIRTHGSAFSAYVRLAFEEIAETREVSDDAGQEPQENVVDLG
jgi:hypothetical protein